MGKKDAIELVFIPIKLLADNSPDPSVAAVCKAIVMIKDAVDKFVALKVRRGLQDSPLYRNAIVPL